MPKTYPTAERVRELFSFDSESGQLLYRVAPYRKPHLLGTPSGHIQKRDNMAYIRVDGESYVLKHIVALHQTGEIPKSHHHLELTHARLLEMLRYEPATGEFFRLASGRGITVGARADYKEHNGYRYVNIDGARHLAARLAWFYVNGEWPKRILRFQDGNEQNCAIDNLDYGEFDFTIDGGRAAYLRDHRKLNRELYRDGQLKRDFGITLEQYQALFVSQGGVCAVCQSAENDTRDGNRKWLAVDHDHTDNTIRGLLCTNCNNGIGRFKDNAIALRRAADYLEAHAAKSKTNVIPLSGRRIANTKS